MHRLGLTVIAAVAMLLAGCGEDAPRAGDSGSQTPSSAPSSEQATDVAKPQKPKGTEVELTVAGGKRTAGPAEVEVAVGEQVTFVVRADAPDELHLHGYDQTAEVQEGKPTRLRVTADLPGVWELELHHSGELLTELKVTG